MKISIIGTGNVGGALARAWAAKGHSVAIAGRDGTKAAALAREVGATNGSIGAISKAADVIVLAVPFGSVGAVLAEAGDLNGKIVIDCTNPFTPDFSGITVGHSDSAAEQVARLARGARVVKTLNHTFAPTMAQPVLGGQSATAFVAGDDEDARRVVAGLVAELGLDVVDAGGLAVARHLEPLAALLIGLGFAKGMGTNIAFKLIRA